ncbi:hypothetical protein HDU93_005906, partial [Gonapodya sp. JEL0774]
MYGVLLGSALKSVLTLQLSGAAGDKDSLSALPDSVKSKDACVNKLVAIVNLMKETVQLKEFDDGGQEAGANDTEGMKSSCTVPAPIGSATISIMVPKLVFAVEAGDKKQIQDLVSELEQKSKQEAERTADTVTAVASMESATASLKKGVDSGLQDLVTRAAAEVNDVAPAVQVAVTRAVAVSGTKD